MSWFSGNMPEGNSERQEYLVSEIEDAARTMMHAADDLRAKIEDFERLVYQVRASALDPDAVRRCASGIANKADNAKHNTQNAEAAISDLMRYLSGELGM